MTVDLVLVSPGGSDKVYQGLSNDLTAIEPPLWCRLIAGYAGDRGFDVRIVDKAACDGSAIEHPALICIVASGHQPNASTQTMPAVIELCQAIKGRNPDQRVIIVGGHVAALPERSRLECGADFACNGEGPVTVVGLLAGDDPATIPGLVWESGQNAPAKLVDVEELHGDVWGLLPMDRYRAHNWQCFDGSPRQPYASIYTSLGCPFKCSFCCINAPFGGPGYRTRRPGDVVAEVAMLHDRYGVRTFKIIDEMFVLKPSHYLPVCEGLAELPFADELNIWAYARVDTVRHDTLALLRRAGVRWLALGIESGSAHVRDGAEKSLGDEDILGTVRAVQAAGINVIGNFIFGLPDDTLQTMRGTLDLARELNCEFANFYSAMAYPGSKLFQGAGPDERWSSYSQHSIDCAPLATVALSPRDVLKFRDRAFYAYFRGAGYREMIDRKFGAETLAAIKRMCATTLVRAA